MKGVHLHVNGISRNKSCASRALIRSLLCNPAFKEKSGDVRVPIKVLICLKISVSKGRYIEVICDFI